MLTDNEMKNRNPVIPRLIHIYEKGSLSHQIVSLMRQPLFVGHYLVLMLLFLDQAEYHFLPFTVLKVLT